MKTQSIFCVQKRMKNILIFIIIIFKGFLMRMMMMRIKLKMIRLLYDSIILITRVEKY